MYVLLYCGKIMDSIMYYCGLVRFKDSICITTRFHLIVHNTCMPLWPTQRGWRTYINIKSPSISGNIQMSILVLLAATTFARASLNRLLNPHAYSTNCMSLELVKQMKHQPFTEGIQTVQSVLYNTSVQTL